MDVRAVGMGALCDFVSDEEYRQELEASGSHPRSPEEEGQDPPADPRPASWRPTLDEFHQMISFRFVEFATLSDGRRVLLKRDHGSNGWSQGGVPPPHLWDAVTVESLERDVRDLRHQPPPDGSDWAWYAERLSELGVQTSASELQSLPFEVVLSGRLLARVNR